MRPASLLLAVFLGTNACSLTTSTDDLVGPEDGAIADGGVDPQDSGSRTDATVCTPGQWAFDADADGHGNAQIPMARSCTPPGTRSRPTRRAAPGLSS